VSEATTQAESVRNWMSRLRFARISPRKVRLIVDLVRGRSCSDAMEQLRFNRRRAARFVQAVLRSAMVSADEAEADMRRLYVSEARVDDGPHFRRWRPKDRGRVHPIEKRTSHITVKVAEG